LIVFVAADKLHFFRIGSMKADEHFLSILLWSFCIARTNFTVYYINTY
jgi:hypothetical protein